MFASVVGEMAEQMKKKRGRPVKFPDLPKLAIPKDNGGPPPEMPMTPDKRQGEKFENPWENLKPEEIEQPPIIPVEMEDHKERKILSLKEAEELMQTEMEDLSIEKPSEPKEQKTAVKMVEKAKKLAKKPSLNAGGNVNVTIAPSYRLVDKRPLEKSDDDEDVEKPPLRKQPRIQPNPLTEGFRVHVPKVHGYIILYLCSECKKTSTDNLTIDQNGIQYITYTLCKSCIDKNKRMAVMFDKQ